MINVAQAANFDPSRAASLGVILGVRGGEARIAIPVDRGGATARATVGDFVRIFAGTRRLIGMITEVESQDVATRRAKAPSPASM